VDEMRLPPTRAAPRCPFSLGLPICPASSPLPRILLASDVFEYILYPCTVYLKALGVKVAPVARVKERAGRRGYGKELELPFLLPEGRRDP
jgi:hypothetical protein